MVFIESRPFTRRLHELARNPGEDEILRRIQEDLLKCPERGDMVRGLGGIRKARTPNAARGKGKSGGYRYLYLYLVRRDHIHLLLLLDKAEQGDLTTEQRKVIRQMVGALKGL